MVPDQIINSLVEERLSQPDCQLNGWVLEGYPMTEAQLNQLEAMKLRPHFIFMLNMPEDDCLKRIGDRRIDPYTGKSYNLKLLKLKNKTHVEQLKAALDIEDAD
jgi:adenylate kinase